MLIAAAVIAAMIAVDESHDEFAAATTPTPTAAALPADIVVVSVVVTSHLLARPSSDAEIVAIVPELRLAEVTGRTEDGAWLRLTYPVGTEIRGWMPASHTLLRQGDTTTTESIPLVEAVEPPNGEVDASLLLPDLTISDATVLPNGRLSVRIDNIGASAIDAAVGLEVTGAEGALLGVFTIEDLRLAPGRSATVPTTVEVTSTGVYRIELDRLNQIEESGEFNNTLRKLLAAVR